MSHSACVIHMSHYHVNEASRKKREEGKVARQSFFERLKGSIGFTLRLIEANVL